MRKRAFLLGREMVWSNVATLYMNCFERVREQRMLHPRPVFAATMLRERRGELPSLKLDHLRRLTDDTGILQHAVYTVPNYNEGYTTDDNARALLLAVLLELGGERVPEASRYMAFLWHAFNPDEKRFRNLLSYERRWREERGSEDCHGRAFWSLGTVLGRSKEDGLRGLSGRLFEASLEPLVHFTSPRAWAFAVIGLQEYLNHFPGDRAAREAREQLARKLLALHRAHATKDWYWFEDTVAYDNASLPYGLLAAGAGMSEPEMIERGLGSLRWLATVETVDDHFAPVGSNGLFSRGCERARFDQQPVEAHSMVAACVEAWRITQDRCWLEQAQRAFEWFLGRNDIGCALYDPSTGGCRDGLHPDRVNANQGAEATLSFLLSLVLIEQAYHVFRS